MAFLPLCVFSFTVPFILGLDDFAGYVPLFDLINVFGFAIGVFSGHMFLNIMLYIGVVLLFIILAYKIFAYQTIWGKKPTLTTQDVQENDHTFY